jgi:hypothetical protein
MELAKREPVMTNESNKVNNITLARMEAGFDVLDAWSETASPSRKNAIYQALFAMQDGSLFCTYRVIDDFQRADEVTVVVKDDLMMKIRFKSFDAFDIVSIGPSGRN